MERMKIFPDVISMSFSSLKFDKERITDSADVPTMFAKSSREIENPFSWSSDCL
jgi:hypothetical protein